jgi:hypothetical protein
MRRNRLLFISMFFLIAFLFGFDFKCGDEKKDEIKIYITCSGSAIYNNSFNGYYIYNSGSAVSFSGIKESDLLYTYTAVFDDLDSVEFEVNRVDVENTLKIRVYKDGTIIDSKTKSITATDTTTYTLDFTYNYGG